MEIDGVIHDLKHIQEYDLERETQIKNLGLTVLRFSNEDVFRNGDFIEREIRSFAETRGKFVPF